MAARGRGNIKGREIVAGGGHLSTRIGLQLRPWSQAPGRPLPAIPVSL